MANRSVSRRTNKLTKKLKADLFIMNKKEIRHLTNNEPDFVATVKMFISGCNRFIFMFDNFREEALQTLVNYLLPRGISQPDWWPNTNLKWWAQLGFPTHKGEPPFELDSSKLPKVWKVAVLVGIIQNHSPRVICYALRLDEKMKAVTSEKEKFILSAALTILDQTFASNSNEDAGSSTGTCKEYVVLGLLAPLRLLLSSETGSRSTDQSRKRKRATPAKKENPLAITAGTSSNPISSRAPIPDVARPDGVADQRNISDSGKSLSELLINTGEEAPAGDVNRLDDDVDLRNISDSGKSSSELHNTAEEIFEVPSEPAFVPGDAPDNKKELSELKSDEGVAKSAEEMGKCSEGKMKGIEMGESSNSAAPINVIPPLGVDVHQVDELLVSHEVLHPVEEFLNDVFNFEYQPKL